MKPESLFNILKSFPREDLKLLDIFIKYFGDKAIPIEIDLEKFERKTYLYSTDIRLLLEIIRNIDKRLPIHMVKRENRDYLIGLSFFPFSDFSEALNRNEIQEKIKNRQMFFESFDTEKGIIHFAGKSISVVGKTGKKSNSVRLLRTITKDPYKIWFEDEILEDWEDKELSKKDLKKIPRNRVYHAARQVNIMVEIKTGVSNLLSYADKEYRINPMYLRGE